MPTNAIRNIIAFDRCPFHPVLYIVAQSS